MDHNARQEADSTWLINRPWRQGRKVGRNIYADRSEFNEDDVLIGQMDSEWIASWIVLHHNVQRLNDG